MDGEFEGVLVGGGGLLGSTLIDGNNDGQGVVGDKLTGGSVGTPQLASQLGLLQYAGPAPQ